MSILCPFPTCGRQHLHPHSPFRHGYVPLPFDIWDRGFHARWKHWREPCCAWCDMWREHAYWFFHGSNLHFFQMLPFIPEIEQAYHGIHERYKKHKMGKDDLLGSHNYGLSYELECLSQQVWGLYKIFPESLQGFNKVSEALRDMSIELQIGPSRELYHTMPRLVP
ncbi:hypothetical protein K458DRAFT_432216 [Lentithecium fluviatile CBS 122367]|uniref:Uncharacterized protein n=1 Tax=Lentithecium fluviatile CBS 122367 TaxID=1168545 RepID=A0A6G1IYU8_9PLEO|nr:hypothetical protein K458DRAFT_432216 [Lentithecium fluviatile CBS 122367]